jgi:hypothetical protein
LLKANSKLIKTFLMRDVLYSVAEGLTNKNFHHDVARWLRLDNANFVKVKFLDHCKRQEEEESSAYTCSNCGKTFALERLLRDHVRSHM